MNHITDFAMGGLVASIIAAIIASTPKQAPVVSVPERTVILPTPSQVSGLDAPEADAPTSDATAEAHDAIEPEAVSFDVHEEAVGDHQAASLRIDAQQKQPAPTPPPAPAYPVRAAVSGPMYYQRGPNGCGYRTYAMPAQDYQYRSYRSGPVRRLFRR